MFSFKRKEKPTRHTAKLDFGITLDQWRSSEVRTKWMQDMILSPMGGDMFSVLQNTIPVPGTQDPIFDAGRVRGYQQALHVLKGMAQPSVDQPELPEPDYSPDNLLPES